MGMGIISDMAGSAMQQVANFKMLKRQQAHQVGMYKHRYQWTMEDMKKAGLNPILAYRQGTGSGSPATSGAGASARTGTSYASSAKMASLMKVEKDKIRSEGHRNEMLSYQASANAQESVERAESIRQLRPYLVNSALADSQLKRSSVPRAQADETFYGTKAGQWTRMLQRLLQGVRGGGS